MSGVPSFRGYRNSNSSQYDVRNGAPQKTAIMPLASARSNPAAMIADVLNRRVFSAFSIPSAIASSENCRRRHKPAGKASPGLVMTAHKQKQ